MLKRLIAFFRNMEDEDYEAFKPWKDEYIKK